MDGGRQSRKGRVVATFYDLCNKLWSGSPATKSMDWGVDTATINSSNEQTEIKYANVDSTDSFFLITP